MPLTDAEILNALQAGNDSAFALFVDRYRDRLMRFAARTTGDLAAAEDLVQDTFSAVYTAADSYNPRFAVSTWVWTILLNLCRRRRRGLKSQSRLKAGWAARESRQHRPDDTALETLVRHEQSRLLREQLAALPAPQADALRLRFFAGLSFEEIADAMNSSVSGAKVRVRKGLDALARRLEQSNTPAHLPTTSEQGDDSP